MSANAVAAVYVVALIVTIVALDLAGFRHRAWERLIASVGIAPVFTAFYFRFRKSP